MITATGVSVAVDGATLLSPVDLHVAAAETVAIRGENGCGKTTLLQVLAGLTTASTGDVAIADRPVNERDAQFRRRVAGMIGAPPFACDLTVREHIALVAATWGLAVDDARHRADQVLGELGIEHLADRFPHEMSSGQTQLAGLALVLARPCDVLLLDEPEQRLDADRIELLIGILTRLRHDGVTIVLATHSDRLAQAVADRSVTLVAA